MTKIIASVLLFSAGALAGPVSADPVCPFSQQETLEFINKYSEKTGNDKVSVVQDLAKITRINFSGICLRDEGIAHACNLPALKQIDIYSDDCPADQAVTGENFELLQGLTSLKNIDLDHNQLKAENLPKLNAIKTLNFLKLLWNDFGLHDLKGLEELKLDGTVILGGNKWENKTPAEIAQMLQKMQVKKIVFGGITGESYSDSTVMAALEQVKSSTIPSYSVQALLTVKAIDNLLGNNQVEEIICTGIAGLDMNSKFVYGKRLKRLSCGIKDALGLAVVAREFENLDHVKIATFDDAFIGALGKLKFNDIHIEPLAMGKYIPFKAMAQLISTSLTQKISFPDDFMMFTKFVPTADDAKDDSRADHFQLRAVIPELAQLCSAHAKTCVLVGAGGETLLKDIGR